MNADYFRAMGIPFVEGRTFAPGEMTEKSQAVVINESMARRFFVPAAAALEDWARRIAVTVVNSCWRSARFQAHWP